MKLKFCKERRSVTGFHLSHNNDSRAQASSDQHGFARVLSRRNVGAPHHGVRPSSGAANFICNNTLSAARAFLSGENRCGRGRPHSTL